MPTINGIAHIQLTVTDMAVSRPFYRKLLTGLGLTLVNDTENSIYGVGGRTGVSISKAAPLMSASASSSGIQGCTTSASACARTRT